MAGHRPTPAMWCLIAGALFGASPPLAKALLADLGPLTLAGLLYLGAAAAVLPFAFRGGSRERRRQPRHLGYLAGAVVLGGVMGPVLLLWGLDMTPAASASLWLNFETVATAICAWLLFREHMGWRAWIAVGGVVLGGAMLAYPFDPGTSTGAALIIAACVCWGLDNNFTALLDGYTPAQSTLIKGVVAGTFNLSMGLLIDGVPAPSALAPALGLGAAAYGLSLVLYVSGAHHLGATRSQMLFATAPLWGVLVAWLVLGEPTTALQLLALAPMAAGIALLLTGSHAHEHSHFAMQHSHSHRHDDGHHDHLHSGQAASVRHTHEHLHKPISHSHDHQPDLHHRHDHGA